ncbi:MAG: carboxymethylenebutenolidase [Thermomicrobiales bacterium]|nr:carboxymethylenebutenolidase [Thermomicrobiales bacterium]
MRPLGQFETYLVHEFVEDYEDGLMTRRDMMRRVLHITGSVAATATILTKLGVTPAVRGAEAQEATPRPPSGPRSPLSVPADDPRIIGEDITFPSNGATIMAYQARPSGTASGTPEAAALASPAAGGAPPLVLICHENRGLTEHIRDVARRWAVEGYVACAVDLLSREGGTASIADPSQVPSIISPDEKRPEQVGDFQAAIEHYKTQDFVDSTRIGMTGFCFGGGVTWLAATQIPELNAAAPYYGPPPPLDQVPNIRAAVIGVYSDDPNDGANEGRDELVQALQAAGVTFEIKVYPNTQHAFNNDTGSRYNEEQSLAAWSDVTAWFEQYVKGA